MYEPHLAWPYSAAYALQRLSQQAAKDASGMLAAQLLPGGLHTAKRGVHRTGTISPGFQLPAASPYDFSDPAVDDISVAEMQHKDTLLNDDFCLSFLCAYGVSL